VFSKGPIHVQDAPLQETWSKKGCKKERGGGIRNPTPRRGKRRFKRGRPLKYQGRGNTKMVPMQDEGEGRQGINLLAIR